MADSEQSPTVEIAPTVIVSNSSEGSENGLVEQSTGEIASESTSENSEPSGDNELSSHHNGDAGTDGASSDVTIAEIEASRDVALAEISASVERERIELEAERVEAVVEHNEEIEECRREIADLREKLETVLNSLTPPPQLAEVVTEEALEIVPETNLTQPSTAAPTIETMTEPSAESVEESPVVEMDVRGRRFIAI